MINGAGFKGEPVLNFSPALWSPANYTITVVSDSLLKLTLVEGSKWSSVRVALMLKGINVGDGDVRTKNHPNPFSFEPPLVYLVLFLPVTAAEMILLVCLFWFYMLVGVIYIQSVSLCGKYGLRGFSGSELFTLLSAMVVVSLLCTLLRHTR